MREKMRRKNEGGKKGKEGRRNTHSVGEHHRFYVTQTSPYIAPSFLRPIRSPRIAKKSRKDGKKKKMEME